MDERFEVFATEKGQVVIPAALRQRSAPQKVLKRLRGAYKGTGLMKAFMEERAWEIEKEEKDIEEWKAKKTTRV